MASQVNPVIAAFLQAQQLGQQDAENIMRQKQFQENLAFQRESQEAEQQLQQSQLQQRILEEQNRAKESETRLKQDLIGRRTGFFRLMSDAAKGGSFDPEAFRSLGASVYGLDPNDLEDMIQKGRSYAEILKAQTNAKKEQQENYFNLSSRAKVDIAEKTLPIQQQLLEARHKFRMEEIKTKSDEDYKRMIDSVRERGKVQKEIAQFRAANKVAAAKLDDKTTKQLENLTIVEELFNDLKKEVEGERGKKYFVGPLRAGWRDIATRPTGGLTGDEKAVESIAGRLQALVAHPIFGASFTKGEEKVVASFIPKTNGSNNIEEVKAMIDSGLKYIQSEKRVRMGNNSVAAPTNNGDDKLKKVLDKYPGLKVK